MCPVGPRKQQNVVQTSPYLIERSRRLQAAGLPGTSPKAIPEKPQALEASEAGHPSAMGPAETDERCLCLSLGPNTVEPLSPNARVGRRYEARACLRTLERAFGRSRANYSCGVLSRYQVWCSLHFGRQWTPTASTQTSFFAQISTRSISEKGGVYQAVGSLRTWTSKQPYYLGFRGPTWSSKVPNIVDSVLEYWAMILVTLEVQVEREFLTACGAEASRPRAAGHLRPRCSPRGGGELSSSWLPPEVPGRAITLSIPTAP